MFEKLTIKPSVLLRQCSDAMLTLTDAGVVLYMNWWTLYTRTRNGEMLNPTAPEGSICAVCAGGAWSHVYGGRDGDSEDDAGASTAEHALDDFRNGAFWRFAQHFADPNAVLEVLVRLEPKQFRGLVRNHRELFGHFDKAIAHLERAGL